MKNKITIGVSKLAPNYKAWLYRLHEDLEIIDMYSLKLDEALKQVSSFSGILLSGGSDIHPGSYGRDEDLHYCKDIDEKRDQLEKAVIEMALRLEIPILGICRGHQMLNVAEKGTLYADIPAFCSGSIVHSNTVDVYHTVKIKGDSLLFKLTGLFEGTVNSAHHQAVNLVGLGLVTSATSADHLIEAIEAADTIAHPFCLAVQWHPERMDLDNPLSGLVGRGFIQAALGKAISDK